MQEFAASMNGREYPFEPRKEESAFAKANGWVIAFGASDDLLELRGAVYDEDSAPGEHLILKGALIQEPESDEMETLRKFGYDWESDAALLDFVRIKSHWCPETEPSMSWNYEVNRPHSTFDVMEDGEIYCRGIVFALENVTKT